MSKIVRPRTGAELVYSGLLPLPERQLIARIRAQALKNNSRRFKGIGIGDDCALLQVLPGHELLLTTDFSLEGVHFRREWHPPESVGHRCLARGLSDIAAMGGKPLAALLSLAVPQGLPQKWVDDFIRGLLKLADRFKTTLAGGDTAQSPGPIFADIMVLGSVPAGRAVLRSGAGPGDSIYVTGELGGSAAKLDLLFSGRKRLAPSAHPGHFFPEPRIELGRVLREKGLASAMIDLSDGLSTDLSHICEESGAGAEIWAETIPRAEIGKSKVDYRFALNGGEDYELLFTASRGKQVPPRIAGVRITKIGVLTRGRQMFLTDEKSKTVLKPRGWEHLR
jgi:thiamine-monophosphate kinase